MRIPARSTDAPIGPEALQEQVTIAALAQGLRAQRTEAEGLVSLISQAVPLAEGVGTLLNRFA